MNHTISNDLLVVQIKSKGAELFSVLGKKTKLEYLWSGDPAFWGKTSPVLFPIVGTLKDNTYIFKDKKYSLSRHGFAREADFTVEKKQQDSVVFLLRSSAESLQKFPFPFELRIGYSVVDDSLHVTYHIKNTSDETLYFSIGGHPAFKVPLVDGSSYEDQYLEFNKTENAPRWPISPDGLIMDKPTDFLQDTNTLPLTKDLFKEDALVFKHLRSDTVSIRSRLHPNGLDFNFEGFPFLGIWAAKNADFVCIEPWCGIADHVGHDQELVRKEGIEALAGNGSWEREWKVRFY